MASKTLRFVLGDQLSRSLSSLRGLDLEHDVVVMVEVHDEATYVKHHKQKIVLVLSAMRHFADSLRSEGITVDYIKLDDTGNTGSFGDELGRAILRHKAARVVVTEPGEWRVRNMMRGWAERFGLPVEILEDDRFLASHAEFENWAEGRKNLRMEFFYREMRRKNAWLMDGDKPEGGQWNYDTENRKSIPRSVRIPERRGFGQDAVTREVMIQVEKHYSDHFGDLDSFAWAVTREEALEALDYFVSNLLPSFGDYQDAMKTDEDFIFHSILSPYINIGLLEPREVCEAALDAYKNGLAPIAAVEGFVRQILGWREYVRGIYWLKMPDYAKSNFLEASRPLPDFYWTGETDMNCLQQTIEATHRNAYAHHIQRLMITGNFALLAGVVPSAVEEWYLIVYADAFEWVELPNTHGMVLHADGGFLGSKPYAASGSYINRMSDYCKNCAFDPKIKLGPKACPFNYLYWNFLIRNKERLQSNPRMGMPYRTLGRMDEEKLKQIVQDSEAFLEGLKH
ncbi:cryptochrome/photolyase family protein [Rubellicoccus peritrichatus]|uniref:Cryptochrome/photolyase family protein n=1 Tax=Rubellicoccus peritrichatus TaxID=3080537 RepID=A0AAQ3QS72_9BACT|nr:cryptochrome/photolyase family protein [Puniceicoccus sp. CR14]WOO42098.1 cryptochrome/photolyase family protein [Puniceicoccus sp. CR14]